MIEQVAFYMTSVGSKIWHLPSKGRMYRHRENGPAVEWLDGTKKWYVNNNLHRLDGPAVEYAVGPKEWYMDGERHRLDGPAFEGADGTKVWFINGKKLPIKEVETWLEENNVDLKTDEGQMAFKLRWL